MSMPDYYKILGVARNATQAEIQKAYRALLRKYHPDINPGNKQAEEKTKEINAAYDILGDQEKRHNYDIELTMSEKSSQSYTNYSNYTNNDDDDYYDSDDDDDDDKEYYEYDEEVERNSYKFNQSYRRKSSNNTYNSFETLKNTPIFTILENFDEYPFNVATKAIYKHGFFPLFGNSIACGFIIIGTIINRIYKLFAKEYLFKHETYSIKTFEWLNECIIENKLLKYTWWGIVLASMAAFKLFVFAAIIFVGLLILLLILISSGKRKK